MPRCAERSDTLSNRRMAASIALALSRLCAKKPVIPANMTMRPHIQGERREAAADDVEFVSELNGCLPFAPPCKFGGLSPQSYSERASIHQMRHLCLLSDRRRHN